MSSAERTLVLMRHAKAEGFADDDHARVLTERGLRDATEAGLWLASKGLVPDHAMVSSSARTTSTWEALAASSRCGAQPAYDDGLYAAGPEAALEVICGASPEATILAVVGHSPTIPYLAHVLSDGLPDPTAFRAISQGYPTAAVTILEVPVAWADLAEGTCRIVDFHVGHG